jgi:hypothetical protein
MSVRPFGFLRFTIYASSDTGTRVERIDPEPSVTTVAFAPAGTRNVSTRALSSRM